MSALRPFCAFALLLSSTALHATTTLSLHGSNTIGERLAPALLTAWLDTAGCSEPTRTESALDVIELKAICDGEPVAITVHAHGTSTGFAALKAGQADLWMASRPVSAAELAQLDEPLGLDRPEREHVIALDGLSVIVHPDLPLKSLDLTQVRAVFAGQVRNWKALGGPDLAISLHARDDQSGTWDSFRSMVLAGAALGAGAQRYESSTALVAAVAAQPGAIGFVGLAALDGKARALAIADGEAAALPPSVPLVAVEDYPLTRRLYLYPRMELSVFGLRFLEFVQSRGGQAVVARSGLVPLDVQAVALPAARDGATEYTDVVTGAQRLGLNFRFSEQTATLDSRAERDLERLVAFMQQPEQRGHRLRLAGFADSREMPYAALALSTDRADYIASRLNRAGIAVDKVRGLGQWLPVADNGTTAGRARNRRVEVWLAGPESGRAVGAVRAGR